MMKNAPVLSTFCQRRIFSCSSWLVKRQEQRCLSSSTTTPSPPDTSRRHKGIMMHPDSVGQYILPGNVVSKTTLTGKHLWQPVILEHGHFWMLRDLRQTGDKPVLTTTTTTTSTLIDEKSAKVFPSLSGLECLDQTAKPNVIDVPTHWLRKNRTQDANSQCTLVGMAFRDYGYSMLQDWLPPIQEKLNEHIYNVYRDRVEIVRLSLNEGYWQKYVLKPIVMASMRRNTTDPVERASTFVHFATSLNDTFRDPIRAHNLMPAYIYLLDGKGRVRWVASGPPSKDKDENEVELLWQAVQEILRPTTTLRRVNKTQNRRRS